MDDLTALEVVFSYSIGGAGFLFGAIGLNDPILGFFIGGALLLVTLFVISHVLGD